MDLENRLKVYEGTKAYQQKMNIVRNGKFYPYKDSLGYLTIGYGHLIKQGENFNSGIDDAKADSLLKQDIEIARNGMKQLNVKVPKDWEDFLIIMIFQLGLTGVMKFKKMLAALRVGDYTGAIVAAKDSLWYRQTPNRVDGMVLQLTNK